MSLSIIIPVFNEEDQTKLTLKKVSSNFKIKELGSKYLFTLFYCLLEKILLNNKK